MSQEATKQWGNQLQFILTTMGFAIGLGNIWRFPYLVFKYSGAAFLIPYFLLLFTIGIPIFFLEVSVGQFTGKNPIKAFYEMAPIFRGLGYAEILLNSIIGFFYNLIITYCVYYFFISIRAELPWKNCGDEPDCFKADITKDCDEQKLPYLLKNITKLRSPSEVFFYDKVIELTDSIDDLGGMNYYLPLCYLLVWIIIFLALLKGVDSLGKISYVTATFPYVIITILVVRGALLEGSQIGVENYIGKFEANNLINANLWKDAAVQAFFSISACGGGLIVMSSFNKFNNNILRDSIIVPISDCLTGFYAGFAIFTTLGHMYLTKCVEKFEDVASQGPELAFVVYPDGISLMGEVAPLFSVFFFIMMLLLGFGTEFSGMEILMSTILDELKSYVNTNKKKIMTRAIVCIFYFLIGLTLVTRGGFHILDLLDGALTGFPFLIVGLLETILVPWIYGSKNFIKDIESMVGKKPQWFWYICMFLWNILCPIALIAILIVNLIDIKQSQFPWYAQIFYWLIASSPLTIVGGFAIFEIYKSKKENGYIDWKTLFSPNRSYYDNQNKYLQNKNNNTENYMLKEYDSKTSTNMHKNPNAVVPI